MSTWKRGLLRIAKDSSINGESLRVLLVLVSFVEYGHFSPIIPAEIGRVLGKRPSNVRRAVKTLLEKGIVKKRCEAGKLVGYEIVEFFGEDKESGFLEDSPPVGGA